MTDDPAYLVCMPTADGPAAAPSTVGACSVCGCALWVSRASVADLAARGVESYETVCPEDAVALAEQYAPDIDVVPIAGPRTVEAARRAAARERAKRNHPHYRTHEDDT